MRRLAEKERAQISKRTKEAPAVAKTRGQNLGNPRLDAGRGAANAAATAGADAHAAAIMPAIREAQAGRAKTLRDIAPALNARDIPTHAAAPVRNILRGVA